MKRNKVSHYVIGFTGGIGSGKSTILQAIKERYDIHLIEADKVGSMLLEKDHRLYYALIKEYGLQVLNDDLTLNKEKVSQIAFKDQASQKRINEIEHPVIKTFIVKGIAHTIRQFVFVEAALLFEGGLDTLCDEIISVTADRETRIQRLMSGRRYTREKCESIIDKQMTDEEFRMRSTVVFDNSGPIFETLQNVFDYLDNLGVPMNEE